MNAIGKKKRICLDGVRLNRPAKTDKVNKYIGISIKDTSIVEKDLDYILVHTQLKTINRL